MSRKIYGAVVQEIFRGDPNNRRWSWSRTDTWSGPFVDEPHDEWPTPEEAVEDAKRHGFDARVQT